MQEAETDNPSPSIFAKHACQWFPPMVDVLTSGKSQAAGIHYMLRGCNPCAALMAKPLATHWQERTAHQRSSQLSDGSSGE